MKFSSNAELARHLIQKIMLDGEVHSKTDITDYVISESKKYELKVPMTNYIIYGVMTVSYTHLDVYKRQLYSHLRKNRLRLRRKC